MKGEYERFIRPGPRGSGGHGPPPVGADFLTTAAWPWRDLGQRARDVRQRRGKGGPERGLEVGRQGYDRVSVEGATYLSVGGGRESKKGRRTRELEIWIIGGLEFWRFCRSPCGSRVTGPDAPFPR